MNKYEKIAEIIETQVISGLLKKGDKIPSLREMRTRTGASLTTIQKAYEILESSLIIEAVPQSGYYVGDHRPTNHSKLQKFEFSQTPELIDGLVIDGFIRATKDQNFCQLTEAMPSLDESPEKVLAKITKNIANENPESLVEFEHPQGNHLLREKIAKRISITNGHSDTSDLLITNGGMESWNICLTALCNPGDNILVEPQIYFGALDIIKSLGLNWIEMPIKDCGEYDLERVEDYLREGTIQSFFVMPNFVGPTGKVTKDSVKKEIVSLFTSYKIPIIEDDVYGDFPLQGKRFSTYSSFDNSHWVVFCGSFSKTLTPGIRLSWIHGRRFIGDLLRQKFIKSMASPKMNQLVVNQYLQQNSLERHLRRIRKKLSEQFNEYRSLFSSFNIEGAIIPPQVGTSFWIKLRDNTSAIELARKANESNIGISPGVLFSPTGKYNEYLRINFARKVNKNIIDGINTLNRLAHQ